MPWFKLDLGFFEHPKVEGVSSDAIVLYLEALAYCARQLTDGHVPAIRARKLARSDPDTLASELVTAGLWEAVSDGFVIHDYLEHQQSRADVERDRAATRARVAKHRRNARRNAVSNGVSTENVPISLSTSTSREEPEGFKDWLEHHARTTGRTSPRAGTKARAEAASAFAARLAEGYTLDDLKRATVGAFNDPNRRENGWYGCESVLRPTKVHDLIERGRNGGSSGGAMTESYERSDISAYERFDQPPPQEEDA